MSTERAERERVRRWRLALGEAAQASLGGLADHDLAMDRALSALYQADEEGGLGQRRRGGTGGSAPQVARWLGDIRSYFPASVVQVMQKDALDRLGMRDMLLQPEMLEAVQTDVHLDASLISGFVNNLGRALFRLLDDFSCLCFRLTQLLSHFFVGQLQISISTTGSIQPISDLLLTFTQSSDDRRPHILHAKHYKNEERNGLTNQGCINVHANTSLVRCQSFSKARITGLLVPGTG